jgi:hypothetical protein
MRTEFPVIIPNQVFGCLSIRSRLPQLLCYPKIGRGTGHIHMDPPSATSERVLKKAKSGRKKRSGTCKRITGPHFRCMIAQERFPVLSTGSKWREPAASTSGWSVRLLRIPSLSNSPRMRSAPQNRLFAAIPLIKLIVSGESLGFLVCAFDLCFGEHAEELTMEAESRSQAAQ